VAGLAVPLMRWDRQVLAIFYLRPLELLGVAGFVSYFGSLIVLGPIAVLLAAILWRPGWSWLASRSGVALAIAAILAEALKFAIQRPHPNTLPQTDYYGAAFPSDHAVAGLVLWFTLALVIGELWPPGRSVFLLIAGILAFLIGWSQLILGVNWPADVLAGWGLGLLVLAALPPPAPPKAGRVRAKD
jgi:membrane-associated phospholipid phosphatase